MSRIDYIFFGVYGEKLLKFLKEGGSKYDNNNNYNDDWNYVIIIWLFMFFFVVGSFVFCFCFGYVCFGLYLWLFWF